MACLDKVILIGKPPGSRNPICANGTPIANFGLAVNRRYRQAEEMWRGGVSLTSVVLGKQAETCGQYLSKGQGALIEKVDCRCVSSRRRKVRR